jgi:hypothetical protein
MSKHEHGSSHKGGARQHSHAWKVRHGQALPIWNVVILGALMVLLLTFLVVLAMRFLG